MEKPPGRLGPAPIRRTQSQRTGAMQERLCKATLDVLADIGYERASTTEICRRAGVSRGAQTHHYASKRDLILAAYDHLLGTWEVERKRLLAAYETVPLEPETYISFLWTKVFDTRHYIVALELALAARGDPELQHGLQRVLSRWATMRDEIWNSRFESADAKTDGAVFHYMTLCMLRGMTTQGDLSNHNISNEDILAAWLDITRERMRPRGKGKARGRGKAQTTV
ncbi:TetR/AcrR family transcriptional regulator [Acidiphilium sp. JA12-A1]|uniref:TetR/AcrR family transcriptional regulator n=1 Tax=Acidiphilium sp. JA12-A1 TaxID=1464546 RepID=UPI0004620340|nr:TetR/AcrR family transcriptional regulator [Acidiphilium sp. JA12-A1]KDM65375.1 HTH-type transcriptional regulator TetR family [Acidiphilium sp. JA12-A1]